MKIYTSDSPEETKKIAGNIAKGILQTGKPYVIALSGELGSGKTTFTQGFAEGLGIREKIISPTFILIRQHPIPKLKKVLFHIDLYRLENEKDFQELGLSEIINNPQNIILIEWAEKIKKILPNKTVWISFETVSEKMRKITAEFPS